nr:homeobox protein Hox-C12 isoform X2 [Zootoca vivipara]
MGEHNLLNPGFVGPLVNIHTGDTFYFPNFRASGGQLPGLPSLSYPRRDNVCSLPWASSEPCNGYPQPYLSSPVSINPSFSRACDLARVEESKCYYREACSENAPLKREERVRDNALMPLESGIPNGMSGSFGKFDYPAPEAVPHDPPSCQSLESDSSSSLLNEGNKGATSEPSTMVSPINQGSNLSAGGTLHAGQFATGCSLVPDAHKVPEKAKTLF